MTTVVNPIHPSQRRFRRQDILPPKSMKSVGTNCVSHGFMSVIGKQRAMEDAVTVAPGYVVGELDVYDFFAVYDGYGGDKVSNACRDRMHRLVAEEVAEEVENGKPGEEIEKGVSYWEKVMMSCFKKMDEEVAGGGNDVDLAVDWSDRTTMGSTALVVLVGKEEVVVANCGDSRAVLSRSGVATPLSNDHEPDRADERERIEAAAAGGRILNWNVNHVLDVLGTSRSIGDRNMKPYVTSEPEVKIINQTEKDEFLVIASDGLWDAISDEFACEVVGKCFCRRYLKNYESSGNNCAAEAAAMLTELAMARGSKDNISVIVVELKTLNM
ncbi:probable protein phosphatase 2C 8 isoform X2 [Euphorbia lathyris]|uniref:probable protein phosphatase 2C 8 isoform X2 n=1 Tax=Euphorbia lathyris TaxID=212925 RepID=UPI003313DA44